MNISDTRRKMEDISSIETFNKKCIRLYNKNKTMDINKTINDIRRIEESEDYKCQYPKALRRKEELDEEISKYIWE